MMQENDAESLGWAKRAATADLAVLFVVAKIQKQFVDTSLFATQDFLFVVVA